MKNVMKPEDKILLVLTFIKDQLELKSANDNTINIPTTAFKADIINYLVNRDELESILKKLSDDFQILTILSNSKHSEYSYISNDITIRVLIKNREGVLHKYAELSSKAGKPVEPKLEKLKPVLELSLSSNREVVLNEYFKIKKLQAEKENLLLFDYLLKTPNKTVTLQQILSAIGKQKFTKEIYDILRGFGLNKQMRELFFEYSKDTVKLNNPISKEKMEQFLAENRVKHISLDTEADFSAQESEQLVAEMV